MCRGFTQRRALTVTNQDDKGLPELHRTLLDFLGRVSEAGGVCTLGGAESGHAGAKRLVSLVLDAQEVQARESVLLASVDRHSAAR